MAEELEENNVVESDEEIQQSNYSQVDHTRNRKPDRIDEDIEAEDNEGYNLEEDDEWVTQTIFIKANH